MEITILINRYRLVTATSCRLRLVLQVHTDSTVLCLYVDKCDVVFRKHWVFNATDLDLESVLVEPCYNRYMLLKTRIYCSRYQFLHLFAAANNRNLNVYNLLYNVTAMAASIKFH